MVSGEVTISSIVFHCFNSNEMYPFELTFVLILRVLFTQKIKGYDNEYVFFNKKDLHKNPLSRKFPKDPNPLTWRECLKVSLNT